MLRGPACPMSGVRAAIMFIIMAIMQGTTISTALIMIIPTPDPITADMTTPGTIMTETVMPKANRMACAATITAR